MATPPPPASAFEAGYGDESARHYKEVLKSVIYGGSLVKLVFHF
jgi:hypothetical protein